MRIIEKIHEMQQQAESWRREGKRIILVPTMGYLHEGHLALMRTARRLGDIVVVSIFVNPTQFGPGEDYERYPRDMDRDRRLVEEVGSDVIFSPEAAEMYPAAYQTYVDVTKVTQPLCGKSRPGHFRGVTTIVAKLFNIVKPHSAVFGEKDFQQLVAIRKMVEDLNFDIDIVGHSIVREVDGLAMSSRNAYLAPDERHSALRLNQSLDAAQTLVERGEKRGQVILERVRSFLAGDKAVRTDYVEILRPDTLEEVHTVDGPVLLALAAYVGKARLIDNRILVPRNQ